MRTWSSPLSGLITGLRPPFPTFLARFGRFTHPQLMVDEPLRVELFVFRYLYRHLGTKPRAELPRKTPPPRLALCRFRAPRRVDFHHFRHTKRKTPCCPAPFPGRPHSFFPNEWVEALSQCSPRSHRTSTSPCIRRVRLRLWIPFGERFSHLSSRPHWLARHSVATRNNSFWFKHTFTFFSAGSAGPNLLPQIRKNIPLHGCDTLFLLTLHRFFYPLPEFKSTPSLKKVCFIGHSRFYGTGLPSQKESGFQLRVH